MFYLYKYSNFKAKEVECILNEYATEVAAESTILKTMMTENKDSAVSTQSSSPSSLSTYGVDLRTLNVDLPELQEVDTMAIAKNKALLAAQLVSGACLVEDTSLHFHALGGMPGPYIKWFQQSLKSSGLYNILAAYDDKSATAVCTLAFSPSPHADPILFTGECRGTIVPPEIGQNGFGWDTIFVPDEEMQKQQQQTNADTTEYEPRSFSRMTMDEKNQLSHRGKAVRKLAVWLNKNHEELFRRQQKGEIAVGHQGFRFQKHNVQVFNPNIEPSAVSAEDTIAVRRLSALPSEEKNAASS
jgi:inosine triphosphate pyrophosphatase